MEEANLFRFRYSISLLVLALGLMTQGCGDGAENKATDSTANPAASASTTKRQVYVPQVPNELTTQLYSHLIRSEPGAGEGLVTLRGTGILIHPGSTPTTATFQLVDNKQELRLKLYISPLDAEGLKVPEAGTVNAEILVDGKSVYKTYVDRNSKIELPIAVSGAKELTVRVDNANGKAWWDWFMISVSSAS
jgi:hypothetical protein